jgi:hypothetical protein
VSAGSWLGAFRWADNAEMFFNTVLGLKQMALNLSLSAANVFHSFHTIPWEQSFIQQVKCNLNFQQKDPDSNYGSTFDFPLWCVRHVETAHLIANTTQDLQTELFNKYEHIILNNDLNQIAIQCVNPDEVAPPPPSKWWCYLFFVELTDTISKQECSCSHLSCCPVGLGI